MQSFIILHSQKTKRDEYLTTFFQTHDVHSFDQSYIASETTIGIEEIRLMQKQLYLKPKYGKGKAIVLQEAQNLTIEAQNALLKILEEPPIHVYFFLSSTSLDPLLPTVLSRCSIVTLHEDTQVFSEEQNLSLEKDFISIRSLSITDRLALAERLAAQKESLADWISHITLYLHSRMVTASSEDLTQYSSVLTQLQIANKILKTTNATPRTVLEHTFLTC